MSMIHNYILSENNKYHSILARINLRHLLKRVILFSLITVIALMLNAAAILAQRPNRKDGRLYKPPIVRQPNSGQIAQQAAQLEHRKIMQLLRLMLRPNTNYAAEEMTTITAKGGGVSRQSIKGDTTGRVIRYYTSPNELKGDILLTGPGLYVNYHAATKKVTRVVGIGGDQLEKTLIATVTKGIATAAWAGHTTIAGVNAEIITVTGQNEQVKFIIDPVTGIKLGMEVRANQDQLISRSEILSIQIAPNAVSAKDFMPSEFESAHLNEVHRENFTSIQDAGSKLPFRPVEPTLPYGFHLQQVTILTPAQLGRKANIVLHYTNKMVSFTLHEHLVLPKNRNSVIARNNPMQWLVQTSGGDLLVIYNGHLSQDQITAIRDSLR